MRKIEEIIARTVGAHYDGEVDPADTPNRWASAISSAEEILAVLDAAGLVIVPKEPTDGMLSALAVKLDGWVDDREGCDNPDLYRAMLEARPK